MGMSVFLETVTELLKQKKGVKEILALKCLSLLSLDEKMIVFFAPYFPFQFSHSLVFLPCIDKEEKAAEF